MVSGAHAARVGARPALELFFVRALSLLDFPEVRFERRNQHASRCAPLLRGTDGRHMQTPLEKLGLTDDNAGVFDGEWRGGGAKIDKISPIDGGDSPASAPLPTTITTKRFRARTKLSEMARHARTGARRTVRRLGNALRELKHELGQLVTLETGRSSPRAKAKCRR
jgi:hypothetical protein